MPSSRLFITYTNKSGIYYNCNNCFFSVHCVQLLMHARNNPFNGGFKQASFFYISLSSLSIYLPIAAHE